MSIIYDALQKTQRSREYLKIQSAFAPAKVERRNLKWIVLGSLTLITTAALGGLLTAYWPEVRSLKTAKAQPAVAKTPIQSQAVAVAAPVAASIAAPVPVSAPAQAPAHLWVTDAKPVSNPIVQEEAQALQQKIKTASNPARLTLNGVMISGDEKVVLINNQPFHIGDTVDGMKIVNIEFNNIKVQRDREVLEIRVPV